MCRKANIYIPTLLILLITIFSALNSSKSVSASIKDNGKINLVADTMNNTFALPKNFRKTTDLKIIKDNKNLKLTGLEKLNVSGSQQFTEKNLPYMMVAIGTSLPVTVVDLRQEAHGFINGYPASWADSKNNANAALTREQVLSDEAGKLKSIGMNVPITFYNHPKTHLVPTKVQNEKQLLASFALHYNRVTVRDNGIPSDDMVEHFIDSVLRQPGNTWLHFHCKDGIGRTSTLMIMYDMMKNYNSVSADDIIKRQLALANFKEPTIKAFCNDERMNFLYKFYDYCKACEGKFYTRFSQWKKTAAGMAAFSIALNSQDLLSLFTR